MYHIKARGQRKVITIVVLGKFRKIKSSNSPLIFLYAAHTFINQLPQINIDRQYPKKSKAK